jgi:hypothetical protein
VSRRNTSSRSREDEALEQGRLAALAGLPKDCPIGTTGSLGEKVAVVSLRSAWLYGWANGERELAAMADDAVHQIAEQHPVAAAALRYAEMCHNTRILRDEAARTDAARDLIDAIGRVHPDDPDRQECSDAFIYGPQTKAIKALIERTRRLTDSEVTALATAWGAPGAAARAATRDVARASAWYAADVAAARRATGAAVRAADRSVASGSAGAAAVRAAVVDAALALTTRGELAQGHYDALTRAWARVVGPAHPDDASRD